MVVPPVQSSLFFFNDTATTEIYTLSLHDALPISREGWRHALRRGHRCPRRHARCRSEEHTSELQSRPHLVCRLLLEKKKKNEKTGLGIRRSHRDRNQIEWSRKSEYGSVALETQET